MTGFDIEKEISTLSPELQQKARSCRTAHDLMEFIAENDLELSDEALEMVAGGFAGLCDSEPSAEKVEEDMNTANLNI